MAHIDNFLRESEADGIQLQNGEVGVVPTIASRVSIEDNVFYEGIDRSGEKLECNCHTRYRKIFFLIVDSIKTGTAAITDQPMRPTPIPFNMCIRQFWGSLLLPRSITQFQL